MRTVVGYIPGGFLNSAASATVTGSTDAETGIPINTGLGVGQIAEYGDLDVAPYSNGQVVNIQILTAGSGQTNGTYSATASTGLATISYTISGGALTAASVTYGGTPGSYTVATAPTFTIAAGGTAGTVQAVVGQLFSGTYEWVQLDPAVTGKVAFGTPLFWLTSAASTGIPTVTTVVSGNAPDYAGVSIDPNFGAALPYAFMQINGKMQVLYAASGTVPTTFGDLIQITSTPAATFNATAAGAINTAVTALAVGYALAASAVSSVGLIRNTRSVVRF